jgi:hypothetical protein
MTAEALYAHLATGVTSVCRAWTVRRKDGVMLGFTDHDRDLVVDGVACRADTGLTARALQQTTGLSVDNTEAFGALSAAAITEADLLPTSSSSSGGALGKLPDQAEVLEPSCGG